MKKITIAVLALIALLLTMAGCAAAGYALETVEEKIEHKLDAVENKLEHAVQKAVTPTPAQSPEPAQSSAPAAPAALITNEDAEKIALDYLGLTADQVTRLRSSYEIDDGIPQYDVEFYQGEWEYEFEIHGQTGAILSYDQDHIYD